MLGLAPTTRAPSAGEEAPAVFSGVHLDGVTYFVSTVDTIELWPGLWRSMDRQHRGARRRKADEVLVVGGSHGDVR